MKTCTECGIKKPLSEFRKRSRSKDGVGTKCKDCLKKIDREYNLKNSQKRKSWRKNNEEYLKEIKKKYRQVHKDEINQKEKEYRLKNYTPKLRKQPTKEEIELKKIQDIEKRKQRYIKNFVSEEKECKFCGEKFITQYKKSKIFCSEECAHKNENLQKRLAEKRRKNRIKNTKKIDSDITLPKLFERDNGLCGICGKQTNYEDFIIKEGVFIVGNTYPSIDHIKPLSKYGTHTWDNVQLACKLCNSIKCDDF